MIQTLSPPPASLMNAISVPSGEKRGCIDQLSPLWIGRASPPAIGSR
jgi:hypothetical protein